MAINSDQQAPDGNAVVERRNPVALIGSGAVATSLGLALRSAGYRIDGIISASLSTAKELGVRLGVSVASGDFDDLPESAEIIFVCVPDSAIQDVGHVLANLDMDWNNRLVIHTSGAVHASALGPLNERGAQLLSFHPLQSFPSNGRTAGSVKTFSGVYVGLEGSDEAVLRGRIVAESLGARPVRIPSSLKESYHLAASVASNLFVALIAMANEILDSSGLDAEAGAEMFLPLIEGTLENLRQAPPESALTGPIARGDVQTIRKHLAALHTAAPHLIPAYAALSTEAVRAAVRGGHVSVAVAEDMLDTLHHGIDDA